MMMHRLAYFKFFYSDIVLVLNINNKKSWYFQTLSYYMLYVK